MKKLKLLGVLLVSFMLVGLNVSAKEVDSSELLLECLGSEEICTLAKSITLESSVTLEGEKTVKLDLNENTLTVGGIIHVKDGYNLTVTGNGKVEGKDSKATYLFRVLPVGSLTLENGTYENDYAGGGVIRVIGSNKDTETITKLNVNSSAVLKGEYGISIYGYNYDDYKSSLGKKGEFAEGIQVDFAGKLYTKYMGLTINGNALFSETDYPVINIKDGAVIESNMGIYAAGYGKWIIGNATFKTVNTGLGIKAGQIYIDGAKVTTTGENNPNPEKWGNGMNASGSAIQIETNKSYADNIIIDIKSGEFISEKGYAFLEYVGETTVLGISISGGKFASAKDLAVFKTTEGLDLTGKISGGTYSSDIKSFVASGYASTKNGEVYEVLKETISELEEIDTKEEVKEVTVGIVDSKTTEDVLLKSLAANVELAKKVEGTPVKLDVEIAEVKPEKIKETVKTSIVEKAGKAKIATYFDISVAIKNAATKAHIDNIPELTSEIELVVLLPEDLRNTDSKITREYFIIREHEGKVEKLPATLSEDGKNLKFKSKYFSTYALAYEDTAVVENVTVKEEVPKTLDNISLSIIVGSLSLISAVYIVSYFKKELDK